MATYLLIRFEIKINSLSKAIIDLSHVVDKNINSKSDDKIA
nr:YvrJ family protein [Clostridium sp.]